MASASVRTRPLAALAPSLGVLSGAALATAYASIVVLIPLAAVVAEGFEDGVGEFWDAVFSGQAFAALRFTVLVSLAVTAVDVVMGTLIAWVLVRDDFRGKRVVDALIDLPFALPTIVAGLVLLALYGPNGPAPFEIAYSRLAVGMALCFVTLPFVVRAVQPVLKALDREVEEAAASLGAKPPTIFFRVILPNLVPALVAGAGLSFARAIGEFGSVVLLSGNKPRDTEVSSVYIFGRIESGDQVSAAATSVVLLAVSVLVLLVIGLVGRRAGSRAA